MNETEILPTSSIRASRSYCTYCHPMSDEEYVAIYGDDFDPRDFLDPEDFLSPEEYKEYLQREQSKPPKSVINTSKGDVLEGMPF